MTVPSEHTLPAPDRNPTQRRLWIVAAVVVVALLGVELVLGRDALSAALAKLRQPVWGWIGLAVLAEVLSMGLFARMQNRLLRAAGTRVPVLRSVELAYAAHSLSISLPGGPAFSTAFNFTQMRRFGASAVVATWCIAISGLLSTAALAVIGVLAGLLARGGGSTGFIGALLTVLLIAAVIRVVALRTSWLVEPAVWVVNRVNRLLRRPADRGLERIAAFLGQFSSVQPRVRDVRIAGVWAIGNWAFDLLAFALCCLAASATGLSITQIVVAYAAGMAASTIPLIPAGLGVIDGALVLGLVAGGTPTDDAIAGVLLYRLVSLVLVGAIGWGLWLLLRRSNPASST